MRPKEFHCALEDASGAEGPESAAPSLSSHKHCDQQRFLPGTQMRTLPDLSPSDHFVVNETAMNVEKEELLNAPTNFQHCTTSRVKPGEGCDQPLLESGPTSFKRLQTTVGRQIRLSRRICEMQSKLHGSERVNHPQSLLRLARSQHL